MTENGTAANPQTECRCGAPIDIEHHLGDGMCHECWNVLAVPPIPGLPDPNPQTEGADVDETEAASD